MTEEPKAKPKRKTKKQKEEEARIGLTLRKRRLGVTTKEYPNAVAGSRAPGRGKSAIGARRWAVMHRQPNGLVVTQGETYRTRREAAPPYSGMGPVLVDLPRENRAL